MTSPLPICETKFKLNNGTSIPAVGLGTWQGTTDPSSSHDSALIDSIVHALRSGYRLIDTAQYYGIERAVGTAIRASGVPRAEITVVTKFWGSFHSDPAEALRRSLEDLDVGYVDLFLMHWPWATTTTADGDEEAVAHGASPTPRETWRMMEGLVGDTCRGIGVSNFTQKTLGELLDGKDGEGGAKIVPAVNQVELHAMNPNHRLVPWCQEKGIHVMSWSTMGSERDPGNNPIIQHPLFADIAKTHGVSAGAVSLAWAVQRGVTVIPKSSKAERITGNIRLPTLSEDEMETVSKATDVLGRYRIADILDGLWVTLPGHGEKTLMGWSKVDMGWEDRDGNWLV